LLDCVPDLRAMRVRVDLERVLAVHGAVIALLGDDRRENDLVGMHDYLALVSTVGRAPWLTTSERAQTTAPTSSSEGATTTTRGRLRKLFAATSSSSVRTTRVGVARPEASSTLLPAFVDGSSNVVASRSAIDPAWAWLASADRRAAFAAFRFTLSSKLRGTLA